MEIHDPRFFRRLATRGKLGLGESYTAGEWDADDLVALLRAPAPQRRVRGPAAPASCARLLEARPRAEPRATASSGARRNIAYHYDLGNDLFAL